MTTMNNPIHLLIPMSGQGTRFKTAGYAEPKPLISVSGVPIITRLLQNFPESWPAHFVIAENHRASGLPEVLKANRPQGEIRSIAPHSRGPSFAILEGLKGIPDSDAVFVSYCDYSMVWDYAQFERLVRDSSCDACVVSYRGFHPHYLSPTTYAYSRVVDERVVEVREKGGFTSNREQEFASSGGYYFKSARLLRQAIEFQMENAIELNGEFYTSLTVEALLRMNPAAYVRVFEIPRFFQWGTPSDLKRFEFWERSYSAHLRSVIGSSKVQQVLMPMAGFGSRFEKVTPTPKPLIAITGIPMFEAALRSLPQGNTSVVVTLDRIAEALPKATESRYEVISLSNTPPGQALTTEAGISSLALDQEVIVSACDHAIVLDPDVWRQFQAAPDCDAAIFTIRGFPGATDRPEAFAYVEADDSEPFPLIKGVSVKKPISKRPSDDPLLVGTFWFKSATILRTGINALKQIDRRVNGELYLDSIFELLIESGLNVRMIPLDGYIGWGDPDTLAEALYWQEVFCGSQIGIRERFPGIHSYARI